MRIKTYKYEGEIGRLKLLRTLQLKRPHSLRAEIGRRDVSISSSMNRRSLLSMKIPHFRDTHPENAPFSITLRDDGMLIILRDVQFANANVPIRSIELSGIRMLKMLRHPMNAPLPIRRTSSGNEKYLIEDAGGKQMSVDMFLLKSAPLNTVKKLLSSQRNKRRLVQPSNERSLIVSSLLSSGIMNPLRS